MKVSKFHSDGESCPPKHIEREEMKLFREMIERGTNDIDPEDRITKWEVIGALASILAAIIAVWFWLSVL